MHTVNKTLLENDIDNHLDIPFGVSATAFHFLQIAGFFANFAGIFPSFVGGGPSLLPGLRRRPCGPLPW